MPEHVINDSNFQDHLDPLLDDGRRARGLIPRDFSLLPLGSYRAIPPFDLPLIPESEWQARLDAQKAAKAQLSDIRNISGPNGGPIPSRDQNGVGYCWCHSGTSGMLIARAVMGEPYLDLSAFAVGCMIKGFRDQGGWGAEGVEFMAAKGIPTSDCWPQRSMSKANDNPKTWENAAKHKDVVYRDLDPKQMKAQLITCLLSGICVVSDFNWWSHSVLSIDLVSISPFKTRIWNSWGDAWSENGTGQLEGSKAVPDAGVAILISTPSET